MHEILVNLQINVQLFVHKPYILDCNMYIHTAGFCQFKMVRCYTAKHTHIFVRHLHDLQSLFLATDIVKKC